MNKILLSLFVFLSAILTPLLRAEMIPMSEIYHPVSTKNPEAQTSFNRGLTNVFAYNHDLAFAEFEKASKLDPELAMAYWGMALAKGQNVNTDITPDRELQCYELIQKALNLSPNASKNEQDYIKALSVRYTNDPKANFIPLRFKYRNAMKKFVESYPQDLDAAALYSESILMLDPWKWWTSDGKPRDGVTEAIEVLESILRRNPEHIGANHFYIHAIEESPYPERALMSAHRLTTLLLASGHLLHMPCHIFILTGDYETALRTNLKAIAADREYINQRGVDSGEYPMHYLSHNMNILVRIYMLLEDYENAIKAANELLQFVESHLTHDAAKYAKVPLEVYLYFHKWKEILEYQTPVNTAIIQSYLHFSRGMAFAGLEEIPEAEEEREAMRQALTGVGKDEEFSDNLATNVMEIAEAMLNAAIARAKKQPSDVIEYLKKASAMQDKLYYGEPPAIYIQVSQLLGAALLRQRRYAEAEKAFNKALSDLQRNGRALFGLYLSLEGQGRNWDSFWVKREMVNALRNAGPFTLNDL